jgi:hypothetical protein
MRDKPPVAPGLAPGDMLIRSWIENVDVETSHDVFTQWRTNIHRR